MFKHLIEKGLVKEKKYPNGLSVFKYSRKVFYDALWNTDPLLLEARGMVLDADGNKVIWPFSKVFNYQENGTTLPLDTVVIAPRKVNGFMAACRKYNGELIVSTTGSLDSDFAVMARKHIEGLSYRWDSFAPEYTYLFEICDSSDPHIIEEEVGAYLIGARNMNTGRMMAESWLDEEAWAVGAKRPAFFAGTFEQLLKLVPTVQHEGFMVRLFDTEETVMKIKSPHYLTKKFLMRMGQNKIDFMFDSTEAFKQNIDEEFYDIVDHIVKEFDAVSWGVQPEQQRRHIVEQYFASK